jgi:hypothetical protein
MFAAISRPFASYYQELPENIVPTIAKSAFYTFTVSLLFLTASEQGTINLTRPLVRSGVAALASAIHALVTPLFNMTFEKAELNAAHEIVKNFVVILLSSALVDYHLTSRVNLASFRLFQLISLNAFMAWFSPCPRGDRGQLLPRPFIPDNAVYFCF